jgi:hypothetical protein
LSTWVQLDSFLKSLVRRLGGESYLFADSGKRTLSPPDGHAERRMERFERACASLREAFGPDCLKTGVWHRHLSHEPGNCFVAMPVLSVYHLIVLFDSDYSSDAWLAHVLDHVRRDLGDLVAGLPPLDGNGRAASAATVT